MMMIMKMLQSSTLASLPWRLSLIDKSGLFNVRLKHLSTDHNDEIYADISF